jgi:signal transduction histidine kinase
MALDPRALCVLYVDGDRDDVRAFQAAAAEFSVLSADNGHQALTILEHQDVAVLVAERVLADMPGLELLQRARELRPSAARLLTSRGLDVETALAAINAAAVNGYISKPCRPEPVAAMLRAALEARHVDSSLESIEMRLWHGGQVAAAATIYEELVHELSNPLGALEINASLVTDLLDSAQNDQPSEASLATMLESAREAHADSVAAIEQMKGLVARMRQGRRPVRPQMHGPCHAESAIVATVRIVRAEIEKVARLEVKLQLPPKTIVLMDASVLGQVLLNLVLNAAQAFPEGTPGQHRVTVLGRVATGALELSVEDNGPGIAPEHLERVFEPFFTTKDHGSGLGLAICRELVTRAHGSIAVQNLASGGARFDVTLPIARSD